VTTTEQRLYDLSNELTRLAWDIQQAGDYWDDEALMRQSFERQEVLRAAASDLLRLSMGHPLRTPVLS
jgi:hypothetical protein